MKLKLTLVLTLAFAYSAQAATYYASPSGNDGNSCVQAQNTATPKRTIQNATNCLSPGDTLRLRSGTFSERFDWSTPSGTAGNPIIIENFPGEAPIWAIPSDQMIVLKFYGPNISTDLTDIT